MKLREVFFSAVICLFLIGPFVLYGVTKAGIIVPVELTAEPARYLAGGATSADIGSNLNLASFVDKKLQGSIETEIENYIPGKATAVETNADMQRTIIAVSNILFSWNCYPTYFGSARLAFPQADAVTYLPRSRNESLESAWRAFAEGVSSVATKYPNKRFVLYVVGGYEEPSFDPAYDLTSSPMHPEDCATTLKEAVADAPNVSVLTLSYENAEDYYRDFFRTDHHWNINGAFRAYGVIAKELKLQSVDPGGTWEIPEYWFTGATARWGVDLLRERVFDCNNNFSELVAKRTDGTETRGDDHSDFWNSSANGKPYIFYDSYYDNLGDCTIVGGVGDRSALLVGNSYRGAIQRPLASSYRSLTVNFQLHPSTPVTTTLEEQILAAGADDVIFVANPSGYNVAKEYWIE